MEEIIDNFSNEDITNSSYSISSEDNMNLSSMII